jgi:DNA invertase Pin-like site-specific DNA recombinase
MIRQAKAPRADTPAAAYIRMSGRLQDKSPKEQRAEIAKLAAGEGYRVVEWLSDEAITGDSTTDDRPGLAALLAGAKAGKFKVVLAWHTNRITREDPMDAIVFYNQLRKAGVNLHTCQEGAMDLDDFARQLLLFVNQKGSNDYLTELAAKTVRGKIAGAKTGARNGGYAPYGMDRGEFDASGKLVRRLKKGERAALENHVRLLPGRDDRKLEAVRYAFRRFDAAHLSYHRLALELQGAGYPPPDGRRWTRNQVWRTLAQAAYAGINRWGTRTAGVYFRARLDEIVSCGNDNPKGMWRLKLPEDVLSVEAAWEPIVPTDLFERVNRKVRPRGIKRRVANDRLPLAGLIVCANCGRNMTASSSYVKGRDGSAAYFYQTYLCGSYVYFRQCGHKSVSAGPLLAWLVARLREVYLGPSREALLAAIRAKLNGRKGPKGSALGQLRKRADGLDKQIKRLVTAIRTTDTPELVPELATVREERDALKARLEHARVFGEGRTPEEEAEQIADRVGKVCQRLTDKDPAIQREALRQLVVKIECRFGCKPGKRNSYPLAGGRIFLRENGPFSPFFAFLNFARPSWGRYLWRSVSRECWPSHRCTTV